MRDYTLRHTQCGAIWEASYGTSPEMLICIKCGEEVRTIYEPIIEMVNARKKKTNE